VIRNTYYVVRNTCALLVLLSTACARIGIGATPRPTYIFTPSEIVGSLTHAGRARVYTVHFPPALVLKRRYPLIIVLHGGGGNRHNAAQMSGMNALADQGNFIVVYPDGTGRLEDKLLTWNAGNCCGYALDNNIDDVGFIRALIEKLERDHPINPKQIYVTGMSNGGMMAYRLACELADKIAAIAPVAGALNVECKPTAPISVIAFHGTADQHVLFEGGTPIVQADPHPREDKSVAYAMNFWAQHNRCAPTPQRDERGNIIHDTYTNCADGTAVELYAIKGEGHTWPGGKSWLGGDPPTQEISATKVMWEFFKQHPKR